VALRERLAAFSLTLHPDKTRLIEFGRFAAVDRGQRGLGKPETFNFLGFTHISGRSRDGAFQLQRHSRRDRVRAKLQAIKEELRRRMHQSIPEQGQWLRQVVGGFFAYHAVPTNSKRLCLPAPRSEPMAADPTVPQSEGSHSLGPDRTNRQ